MKKIFLSLAAAVAVMGMVACSGSKTETAAEEQPAATTETVEVVEAQCNAECGECTGCADCDENCPKEDCTHEHACQKQCNGEHQCEHQCEHAQCAEAE